MIKSIIYNELILKLHRLKRKINHPNFKVSTSSGIQNFKCWLKLLNYYSIYFIYINIYIYIYNFN